MRPPQPPLEPTTARTGGRSARVAALVIVVVLVSVVYVGISGRGSTTPTPAAVAVVATPPASHDESSPANASSSALPVTLPGFNVATPGQTGGDPLYRLGIAVTTRSGSVFVPFEEQSGPGLHAAYRIRIPARPRRVTLEVARQNGDDERPITLAEWPIKIGVFNPDPHEDLAILTSGPTVLVDANQAPRPGSEANGSALEISGFHVLVTGEHDGPDEVLNVEVQVTQATANEDPGRRWVSGDDGLVGWPSALAQ